MGFWRRLGEGFWRRSLPNEPPPLAPGADEGTLAGGVKHGLWAERAESGVTTVLFYEHGKKHGPFRDFHPSGARRTEGIYVDGLLEGPWQTWHTTGALAGTATFARGKLEGIHRMHLPSGGLKLESRYVHDLRDGPWKLFRDDGTPHEEGAHDLGSRVGRWKFFDERGAVREEGTFEGGERAGLFVFRDGETRLEATYRRGVLDGPFRAFVAGRSVCEGGFRAGVVERGVGFADDARDRLSASPLPEPLVRRWVDIELAIATLAPPTQLPESFVAMDDDDAEDERSAATRIASHEAWLSLFADTTKLGAHERRIVAKRVEERLARNAPALLPEAGYPAWHHLVGAKEPHALARFITTVTLDHAHFDAEATARFMARHAPQLRRLSLFECTFEPTLSAFLKGAPFEALEALEIADYDRKGRGLVTLTELAWARSLVRVAFDGTEATYDDEKLGALFSSTNLEHLRSLSLGAAEPGAATIAALVSGPVARGLEELHFVQSTLSSEALDATLSACARLRRLKLERCTSPAEAIERARRWAEVPGRRFVVEEG